MLCYIFVWYVAAGLVGGGCPSLHPSLATKRDVMLSLCSTVYMIYSRIHNASISTLLCLKDENIIFFSR